MPPTSPLPRWSRSCVRHEDLTEDEAAAAMHEVMEGRRRAGGAGGPARRAGDEGRAAARDRRLRADDARARGEAVGAGRRVFDTCGTGGDRAGHVQHLVGGGGGRGGVRRDGGQARQPVGLEPVRQRRRLRGARRQRRGRRRPWSSATLREARIAFFFAPTFHPSMKHAAQTRRELGIRTAFNLLGPLTNPARGDAADRRRAAAGADGAAGARAAAARARRAPGSCTAPTASTRSRRPATRRCRSAATARCTRSTCIRPTSALPKAAPADAARAAMPPTNAAIVRGGARRRGRARRATSCCSTPARRSSSPGAAASVARRHRARPRRRSTRGAARATLERDGARCSHGRGGRVTPRRICCATIVAATRRIAADAARARAAGRRSSAARRAAAPRGAAVRGAAGAARTGQRHRRVQAPVAVARRAGRRLRPGARSRAPTRDGGAAAISVLTEPTFFDGALEHLAAVRGGRGRAAAAQGLRRRRVPAVRGARRGRRCGAADRGGARAADARAPAAAAPGTWGWRRWSRCTTRRSCRGPWTSGARVIGVNNRNLRTLQVDVTASDRLAARMPADVDGGERERPAVAARISSAWRRPGTARS